MTTKGPEWCHCEGLDPQLLNGRRDSRVISLAVDCGDQEGRSPKRFLKRGLQPREELFRLMGTDLVSILLDYQTPGGLALVDEGHTAQAAWKQRVGKRGRESFLRLMKCLPARGLAYPLVGYCF